MIVGISAYTVLYVILNFQRYQIPVAESPLFLQFRSQTHSPGLK